MLVIYTVTLDLCEGSFIRVSARFASPVQILLSLECADCIVMEASSWKPEALLGFCRMYATY